MRKSQIKSVSSPLTFKSLTIFLFLYRYKEEKFKKKLIIICGNKTRYSHSYYFGVLSFIIKSASALRRTMNENALFFDLNYLWLYRLYNALREKFLVPKKFLRNCSSQNRCQKNPIKDDFEGEKTHLITH